MKQLWKIITYTKPFKKFYVVMGCSVVFLALLSQVGPLLTKLIVDLIVSKLSGHPAEISLLITYLILILGTDFLITTITDISQYFSDIMTAKLNNYLSEKYYRHVLGLSVEYFDNEITGKIVNKLDRGITSISTFIAQMVNNFLPFFVSTIITLFIISLYSWELAILLFLLFPIYIFISHKSSVAWGKKEGEKNAILDLTSGRVFEALSTIRVIKSFVQELSEFEYFKKTRSAIVGLADKQSKDWHTYDFYRRIILNAIMFSVFGYIIYFTFKGRFTIGEMTLLLQLANQAKFPLFAMSFIIGQLQQAQSGSKDFFDVLATPISISDKNNAKHLSHVNGAIEFKDVGFFYANSQHVLQDISFSIPQGRKLAIVGESGEGKSTIANLILRFYEPQQGEILIDHHNIASVTQESLRKNIGVVFQDTFLFSGTIQDNIRYGREDATEQEIKDAAKIANADDFIRRFPKGYLSEIGERGVKLSGGQKQRIAIARALLKDPPILIFDEATSSLDSKSEYEVQQALNTLMKGRTTIIIAHRLSTIRSVDHIIVIQKGRIVEQGNPKDLEKQNGVYTQLLAYQKMGASSDEKLKEFNIDAE
ncbi:ABC transporter ATP-binding protein [Candidatus Roizmanbacteria bacterium]|nr:ABC transporter ATP-binding protein [Candidatus Roizmanbacteria bacterium]